MFKIPSYDELEKRESELDAKRKDYQLNLFANRKEKEPHEQTSNDVVSSNSNTSSGSTSQPVVAAVEFAPKSGAPDRNDTADDQQPELKRLKKSDLSETTATSVAKASSTAAVTVTKSVPEVDSDDDELLSAFILVNKAVIDVVEKPPSITSSNSSNSISSANKSQSKSQTAEAAIAISTSSNLLLPPKPAAANYTKTTTTTTTAIAESNSATTSKYSGPTTINVNAGSGSGGPLIVNANQRGNPVLKHIRSVQWKYSDTLVPDYCMSRNSCAYYLSMKYHLLNPTYVHQRIRELGRAYDLRVLLVFVDIKDPHHCIKELEKASIVCNLTMILCWTNEEVARYIETYKAYEFKGPELIMEKSSNQTAGSATGSYGSNSNNNSTDVSFINNYSDFICQIKSINKTDSSTLRQTFGSIKKLSKASKAELSLCPGLGPLKVNRLHEIFRTPFALQKKSLF